MPRTKQTAQHSTGGNTPRRELASKAKGEPTAKGAKTRPSPYYKPGQSQEPLAIPSLELQTIPSLELQPIPPPELQPKRSLRLPREVSRRTERRLSSPGPLYHHEVCTSWQLIHLMLTIHFSFQTYCCVCCDGSATLLLCDLCTRVVCAKHLGTLPNMLDFASHDFICMACHVDKLGHTPYHVSPSSLP